MLKVTVGKFIGAALLSFPVISPLADVKPRTHLRGWLTTETGPEDLFNAQVFAFCVHYTVVSPNLQP